MRRITQKRRLAAEIATRISVVTFLGAACVTATDVQISQLAGSWNVPEAVFVDDVDATRTQDVVEEGEVVTMEIDQAGDFTLTRDNNGDIETITGTLAVNGNDLDVTIGPRTVPGEVFLEENRAVLRILGGVTFDFDDNGNAVPARLFLVLDRA